MSPEERKLHLDSFDHVWQTIHDKHWETKPGGLDWDAVRAELRPKAEQAATPDEIRDVIREMLRRLKQSHFHLIAVEVMGALSVPYAGDGEPPFEAQIINSEALVTRVEPGTPVKLGWKIASINGVDFAQRIQAVDAAYAHSTERGLRLHQMLRARLSGQPGATLAIDFINELNRKVALKVPIAAPKGKLASFGNLPPTVVRIESSRIEVNGVGGIYTMVPYCIYAGHSPSLFESR